MLRSQLRHDLPELARIVALRGLPALQRWAHAAAGAFMIVRRKSIVGECRALERGRRRLDAGRLGRGRGAAGAAAALYEGRGGTRIAPQRRALAHTVRPAYHNWRICECRHAGR
ncbi:MULTISPECIES: hypothetical protein [Cupriavidus]|uniref:hypothetical protein n=1 Tax=Cupriavidus sp. DF5525 TaxID=3160989 RepID=UPI0003B05F89|nr:hypothetical protein N234_31500 [Ralstonia pickettii DTP0602]